jgi:hypothetical protein
MKLEDHQRAKKLLPADRIVGISASDRTWLEAHLVACDECSIEAKALGFAIESLRTVAVTADPDAVRRAMLAVHRRAEQMQQERESAIPLSIAAATSIVAAILTTPFAWSAFGWLGHLFHVSDIIWQLGFFLMWWFMPATVLSAIAGWQHTAGRRELV